MTKFRQTRDNEVVFTIPQTIPFGEFCHYDTHSAQTVSQFLLYQALAS